MERGRSVLIAKVKCHISRSLDLYKDFWQLNPCGQDIARTMQSRLLKLSMHTSYGKRKKPINFKIKGQISRSLGLYKDFLLALGSLLAGYSKNYVAEDHQT